MRRILNFIELSAFGLIFGVLWLFYRLTKIKPVQSGIWLWREIRWQIRRAKGWALSKRPVKTRTY